VVVRHRLDTSILEIVSGTTTRPVQADPNLVGGAEPRTIVLRALKAGTTTVNLIYAPPFAPSEPARALGFTVNVRDVGARCSTAGLRALRQGPSVTYSVAGEALRAKATGCTQARTITRVAARTLVSNRPVPKKIGGFKITTRNPCGGCSPIWTVTATRGTARVTFDLAGGH